MTFERWICTLTFAVNVVWFVHSTWNTRYVRREVRLAHQKIDLLFEEKKRHLLTDARNEMWEQSQQ